jgi:hypothetical protein
MGNIFGDQRTLKEKIREQKRLVERSIRSLERERTNFKKAETKLVADIKVRTNIHYTYLVSMYLSTLYLHFVFLILL